jgi:hypothetical protein
MFVSGTECGVSSLTKKLQKHPAEVKSLKPQSLRFLPGETTVDQAPRAVSGVVSAASLPGVLPGSPCVLVFAPTFVAVLTENGEVARLGYRDVSSLEVGGGGTRGFSTSAGIIGGGFGVEGVERHGTSQFDQCRHHPHDGHPRHHTEVSRGAVGGAGER